MPKNKFEKIIESKIQSFLMSRRYSSKLKIEFIQEKLANHDIELQQHLLEKYLEHLVHRPDPSFSVQIAGIPPTYVELVKMDSDIYGIKPDIDIEKFDDEDSRYFATHVKAENWVKSRLKEIQSEIETSTNPGKRIISELGVAEFGYLVQTFFKKGWLKTDDKFENTNWTEVARILIKAFEIETSKNKLCDENSLVKQLREKTNSSNQTFKSNLGKAFPELERVKGWRKNKGQ